MAIAIVQSNNPAPASGVQGSTALTGVTAGNALVLVMTTLDFSGTAVGPISTPTDSQGAKVWCNYQPAVVTASTGDKLAVVFYVFANVGAGSHTVTPGMLGVAANTQSILTLHEVSGLGPTPIIDGFATANTVPGASNTSQVSGTTATLTQASQLALIGVTHSTGTGFAGAGYTAPTGFTQSNVSNDGTVTAPGELAYQILSSTSAISATWTFVADATMRGIIGAIATIRDSSTINYSPLSNALWNLSLLDAGDQDYKSELTIKRWF